MVFTNGTRRTREYESLGHSLEFLESNIQRYNNHLELLSADIYQKFKELKNDFDLGFISLGQYTDFLKMFKSYLERSAATQYPELQADEIREEISKYLK